MKIRKYIEMNESENAIYQSIWNAAKPVFRGKFIFENAYILKKNNFKYLS